MKNNLATGILAIFILTAGMTTTAYSQEDEKEEAEKLLRHRISLMLGHTQIPAGEINGQRKLLAVPSWGLDYNFQINRKWALGLHSDIITQTFTVIDFEGNQEFERERPLTMTLVGIYKPHERWSFLAGAGKEFATEENLSLLRLGIERGWEMKKDWEVFGTFQYDLKLGVYDTFMLGVGFSKGF